MGKEKCGDHVCEKRPFTHLPHSLSLSGIMMLGEQTEGIVFNTGFNSTPNAELYAPWFELNAKSKKANGIFFRQSTVPRRKLRDLNILTPQTHSRHLPLDGQPRSCSLSPWMKTNKQQSRWRQQHSHLDHKPVQLCFTAASPVIVIGHRTNSQIVKV